MRFQKDCRWEVPLDDLWYCDMLLASKFATGQVYGLQEIPHGMYEGSSVANIPTSYSCRCKGQFRPSL